MIGIDLGSRSVKIVQMDYKTITRCELYDTIGFYRRYASAEKGVLSLDLTRLGFVEQRVVATGYGKVTLQVAGADTIPEIQAHVNGAVFQSGINDFTLLDIGGQDTKVIKVREGRAVDFMTNDRCAASSGRYLENMAAVLGLGLEELSACSEEPVELNTTCAIFGETEIIARIVEGHSLQSLAAGVNYSLYRRFAAMLKQMASETIILSGGCALNTGLQRIIARETGAPVLSLPEPQLNGAVGCCVWGLSHI
ncbi:acyl-CoA dehydratase activase [Syntrophomonas palmitatica]|uniref:acyl-CoA dehydratase activase n=1 Tax=Syntrophomonas palmitatica TaxID=402877 RepID=UPI0006CFABD6|nr:acyl-CoA dehydratase activase [Syntrophomonas palmitatica]